MHIKCGLRLCCTDHAGRQSDEKSLLAILIFLLLCSAFACSPNQPPTGNGAGAPAAGEKIILTGAGAEEKEILISEIRRLPLVEKEVVLVRKGGSEEKFTVKGPLLADLLQTLGKDQKSLSGIRLIAGDGYMIEVPTEILANRDIIMAYEIGGQPLEEGDKPVRIIIPEERGMYWVKNLVQIDILAARETLPLTKLIILNTAVHNLAQHNYEYHGSMDKAVAAADLFKDQVPAGSLDTVYMKAADGLEKNEKTDVFTIGYIKFTGADSPAFVSPDIPRGMQVKGLLWLSKGDIGYLSMGSAGGYFPKAAAGDREGVKLSDLFAEVSMEESAAYLFTAADGYNIEINKEDIGRGYLLISEGGEVSVWFDGLPGYTAVKGLLSIESKN